MKKELRDEFWTSFEDSPYVMIRLEGIGGHAEPMTAQLDRDARHTIWFFTTRNNRIAAGGAAMNLLWQWKGRPLPVPLMLLHAALAIVAFVLLIVAAF